MPAHHSLARLRTARSRKSTTAALATAGAAALAFTLVSVPADAQQGTAARARGDVGTTPAGHPGAAKDVAEATPVTPAWQLKAAPPAHGDRDADQKRQGSQDAEGTDGSDEVVLSLAPDAGSGEDEGLRSPAGEQQVPAQGEAGAPAPEPADEGTPAPEEPSAETRAAPSETGAGPARPAAAPQAAAAESYADNLDGWIRESLDIMAANGIPGTYEGLYRNIMRESSGNPNAINLWDINALNGTPSIGLLQVIQPTFDAYHVPGTPYDIYDPVANICAAANYAAHRYGSIDNVYGAY